MKILNGNELNILILAILLLLISSFIFGKVFELIKAPKVVGEIVGGMILGVSGIGLLNINLYNSVFNGFAEEQKILDIFYQLGLMLLMFSSGYSTQISIDKSNAKTYTQLFIGATVIPTILGLPFISVFKNNFIGLADSYESYAIVFLISMSITSIPVISKIFFDINMMNTKYSNMVLSVATIQDLCLWIALNLSISIVSGEELNTFKFISTTIFTIGLLLGVKAIEKFIKDKHLSLQKNTISISLITLLSVVYILSILNINIMYSSFIVGYLIKAFVGDNNNEVLKVKDFGFNFFIPIYFALVGIKLDIIHNFSLVRFIIFFIIAFGAEFIGTVLVMWFSKLNKKAIISLGITMNARGGPGIVLATTAYANNIISLEFFTVLIVTTMLSSTIAGYWLRIFKNDIQNEG